MGSISVAHGFKQKVLNFCENSHMVNHSNLWYVTKSLFHTKRFQRGDKRVERTKVCQS
jgi:hypothetical protein